MHCIMCKKIIPDGVRAELVPEIKSFICMACVNPCGLDVQGLVMHHQCPDGCHVVETWDVIDSNPFTDPEGTSIKRLHELYPEIQGGEHA